MRLTPGAALRRWWQASLGRRLALGVGAALLAGAALLVLTWGWIGHNALRHEHEAASLRMAALFEASLKRAMLQRDLDGLDRLLGTLGGLPGLRAAALVNPAGEVRFASSKPRLGSHESAALAGLCLHAGCADRAQPQLHWRATDGDGDGAQALRVAWPVHNEARCSGCHGLPAVHPVNGVLLLDFAPTAAERQARAQTGTWLLPVALAVLAAVGLAVVWLLRRQVLAPLAALGGQMQRFGAGELAARSQVSGDDELARLAQGFDQMAERIARQIDAQAAHSRWLQSLLDALPDAMLLIGDDHRIVMANAAYARLIGIAPAQAIGQPCWRASRARSEPCPVTLVACPLAECRRGGDSGANAGMRTVMPFTRADGGTLDVEIEAAPLRAPDGRALVIEVIRPLGERLRFSQEQRLSAVGLLANGVAHEIHNPLASIRLALQASLRGLGDGSMGHDEVADYLRLVDQQVDRCVHITQRLLLLSQPAGDAMQPVAVRDAATDVLGLLGEEARRAGVATELAVQPEALRVLADEGDLRQVLVNLVHNALHAMPQGGRLTIAARAVPEGWAEITVSDTGIGIAPETVPLLFLPFYSRRADGQRGTGLGLAICKGLVESRGGRIAVDSRPGAGSRFTVTLHDADAPPAAAGAATDPPDAARALPR